MSKSCALSSIVASPARVSAALALCLCAAGCPDPGSGEKVDVYEAGGTVKLFGSPLADATVAFAPEGQQPTAIGTTDTKGNFQLTTYDFGDGAAAGRYRVVISKSVAAKPSQPDAGAEHGDDYDGGITHAEMMADQSSENMIPGKYSARDQTPLTAEVTVDGENTFDLVIE